MSENLPAVVRGDVVLPDDIPAPYWTHYNEYNGQVVWRFENGYGASVVNCTGSYGVELAVLKFSESGGDDWKLCYDTPITDDVIGWIKGEDELYGYLRQIMSLTKEGQFPAESEHNEWRPFADEHEALEAYREELDEIHGTVTIAGIEYDTSRVLEEVDPIRFHAEFNDWHDAWQQVHDEENGL